MLFSSWNTKTNPKSHTWPKQQIFPMLESVFLCVPRSLQGNRPVYTRKHADSVTPELFDLLHWSGLSVGLHRLSVVSWPYQPVVCKKGKWQLISMKIGERSLSQGKRKTFIRGSAREMVSLKKIACKLHQLRHTVWSWYKFWIITFLQSKISCLYHTRKQS